MGSAVGSTVNPFLWEDLEGSGLIGPHLLVVAQGEPNAPIRLKMTRDTNCEIVFAE